jgi:hypothetical protein
MFCTEPRDPECPILGRFNSDFEFQMCKSEMEDYERKLNRYLSCLDDEKSDAIKKYNKSVERFNCHARGENICF